MFVFDEKEYSLDYRYDYNLHEKKAIQEEITSNENITINEVRRIACGNITESYKWKMIYWNS